MKILWISLIILSMNCALALEGVVTVLNTPLRSKPSPQAQIVQYLRKGEIVKIIDLPMIEAGYIPVWDSLAKVSYIKASHVYIYSQDQFELQQKSLNFDPTDYRKNEPYPSNAPIPITQEGKYGFGSDMKKKF